LCVEILNFVLLLATLSLTSLQAFVFGMKVLMQ